MGKGRCLFGNGLACNNNNKKRLATRSSDKMVPSGLSVRAVLEFLGYRVRAHEARVFKFWG